MKCIQKKCKFKDECRTYKKGIGKEIEPATPKFKKICVLYYPMNKDELDEIVDNLYKSYLEEVDYENSINTDIL